ncbi:MAG: MaoC family dehydratase N-terminal domain-containing protein [Acidobacteria bacterium]|nr:MaoC family dehydratase N-terminal domain-containing protein [Acidobacteriota bacterium]
MALNKALEGKEYAACEPFEVTEDSIRQFAAATGDPNPVFRDEDAAKAAGYGAIIAPPTYLTKLSFLYAPQIVLDPDLGLNYALVVHGEQEFEFLRPVRAGDSLLGRPRIAAITAKGRNELLITEASIETAAGEKVAVARSTIVSRGTAPQEG